jgi:hypothetical protein
MKLPFEKMDDFICVPCETLAAFAVNNKVQLTARTAENAQRTQATHDQTLH